MAPAHSSVLEQRTYRIAKTNGELKEVTALYHQVEDGFLTFKDNGNAVVFSIVATQVVSIERLNTGVNLALSPDDLALVNLALREYASCLSIGPGTDPCSERNLKRASALIDSTERLRAAAAQRASERVAA